jgi:ABC-type multidrug transport system fused ATPase/permease subunit
MEKITKENLYTGFAVLFRYIGHYRREITVLSIMGILSALGNGTIPFIVGSFFDVITSHENILIISYAVPVFVAWLVIWTVVQLITSLLDWRIHILSEKFSNTIWLDYLAQGFSYLLVLPMSFHKQNKIGEIGSKINMAASSLETIAGRIVIDLSPQLLSIVIAFVISFYLNTILASLLVVGVVVYILTLAHKIRPLAQYQKEYHDVLGYIWGESYDVVGNALAVKQATAEEYEKNRLSTKMKSAVPLWMKLTSVWATLTLYQKLIILVTQVVIFILSAVYIQKGLMTIGELIAFNAYAAMVFGPFITIGRNWQTIQNGVVGIRETEKILSMHPEPYDLPGSIAIDIKGDITFEHVQFTYEEGKHVLQDISIAVKAGDVVALVGESGVGKSTLIDLISGYHFASQGTVKIDGHDIKNLNLKKLRQQIAVVPQEVVLFNDTIQMNIKYGNFTATHEEVMIAAKKAHALDFIEKFPQTWEQVVGERGVKLSVGQKQRIAIARAMLRNPRILILDEPTSALDAGSEKIITTSLDELMHGKTTFIIAHRLSTVRKADMILVFKEGRIIEKGTHGELLAIEGGEYRRLHELQIGLHT